MFVSSIKLHRHVAKIKIDCTIYVNHHMQTTTFCKQGVPICKYFGPNPRMHTGIPCMHTGTSTYAFVFLCVVYCERHLATVLIESQHWQKQNGQLLCTHIAKLVPKHPEYESDNIIVMFRRFCHCFDLLVNTRVGCATNLQKLCKHLAR
jgi:hypothetical protein